jgi:hypothetical protein
MAGCDKTIGVRQDAAKMAGCDKTIGVRQDAAKVTDMGRQNIERSPGHSIEAAIERHSNPTSRQENS